MLDSNSFNFTSFANQASGYYTPTPGGTSTTYHNQAGDLHTPGMGFHLGTPLSMPTSEGNIHSAIEMHGFHPHLLDVHSFQTTATFNPQQSYAPSSFVHQDSGFGAVDADNDGLPKEEIHMDVEPHRALPMFPTQMFDASMPAPSAPYMEKYDMSRFEIYSMLMLRFRFRYQITLNAPTAMIRHSDEIPVTYLNKGQAYSMTILDTTGMRPSVGPTKYRTVVRISFEDEQQRQRPSACWQLWKEGRGLAEAHHRAGKLQAVEYVDPNQGGDEETKRPRVEIERASFDCFSVTWSPAQGSTIAECSVAVRFNFLSTDFSHSKGVKGIPVRLCAKTEIVSSSTPESLLEPTAEVCFCKVKLFRDHGAERKLSNDVAHIKKTIDKLKQQISQVESGMKDFGKRKRSGSIAIKSGSHRPGKVQKQKRTWSISSQGSSGRPAAEEDLHHKLATMQDMFTSTRPVSLLYLRGYEQDDPDLYPVTLPGQSSNLTKIEPASRKSSCDQQVSAETTPTNSCIVSPSPSSKSIPSQPRSNERPRFQYPGQYDRPQPVPSEWESFANFSGPLNTQTDNLTAGFSTSAVKVQRQNDASLPAWIDAIGVDPSYQAPLERSIKPIACFYVLVKVSGSSPDTDYYRAVYLMERTLKDLIINIAIKCQVDATRVSRTLRVNPKGLKIMIDDEVVRELPEGQDMTVEFSTIEGETTSQLDQGGSTDPSNPNLEMRLLF